MICRARERERDRRKPQVSLNSLRSGKDFLEYSNVSSLYRHNEELNDLYSSPNIVRVIKSRRMRWAGHVARMGEERGCIGSWWGNRREGTTGAT